MRFELGFGAGVQAVELPEKNLAGVLLPNDVERGLIGAAEVERALKNPILSLAIHSQGEILYFDCGQDDIHPSLKLAYEVRNVTGYAIKYETRRDAAFDDWCIKELGIPSVTVETGKSDTLGVLSISQFEKIWKDNRDLWLHMLKKYSEDAE